MSLSIEFIPRWPTCSKRKASPTNEGFESMPINSIKMNRTIKLQTSEIIFMHLRASVRALFFLVFITGFLADEIENHGTPVQSKCFNQPGFEVTPV